MCGMKRFCLFLTMLCLCLLLGGCGSDIKMASSSADICLMQHDEAVKMLTDAGFINVTENEVNDLSSKDLAQEGIVTEIFIGEVNSFEVKDKFAKDLPVVITYHTVKRIAVPMSSDKVASTDYMEVENQFKANGFTTVNSREVVDLDPDVFSGEFKNEITIDGVSSFAEGDQFPYDSSVSIVCHKPYKKYTIKAHVDCVGNWFFNKYDLNVSFDDGTSETLKHGGEADYEFRVKEGSYKLVFTSAEDSSVTGTIPFENVNCDIEGSYKINCEASSVDITTVFEDRNVELAEDEIKLPVTMSEYFNKNYLDVEKELKDLGFTNIKRMVYYDIVFGWSDDGYTSEIIIDGNKDAKKGEVYKKDVEVAIYYHTLTENDPKVIEQKKAEEEKKKKEEEQEKAAEKKKQDAIDNKPVMKGSDVMAAIDAVEKYGLEQVGPIDDFGHDTSMISFSSKDGGLMIDIICFDDTGEIMAASIVTLNLVSAKEQKNFVKKMAGLLCPVDDAKKVSDWVNSNVGSEKTTSIGGFAYEVGKGPSDNVLYYAGMENWEKWDMLVNNY